MTDKELLEYAAKAAGVKGRWGREGYIERNEGFIPKGWRRAWNPLNNDSDALRLAVILELEIYHGDDEGEAVFVKVLRENEKPWYIEEMYNSDPYAATRRAIVRAAAEIGKAMP